MVPSQSSHIKAVYNPKAVILHAVLLHQTFVHCGRFLTAASRRSLGRISVPVWLVNLSIQLPIVALVVHYTTNKLMGRRPLPKRITALTLRYYAVLADLSASYSPLRGRYQRVTHPSATSSEELVRLACIRHAASVCSEPESNSSVIILNQ